MIRVCMITHDQFEKKDPRADLIRFKCLVESCVKHSIHVVCVTSNERARFEESSYQGSKVVKIPCVSKILMVQLVCFYFFLLPVLLRMRQHGRFHVLFVNSVLTVPWAWIFKQLSRSSCIQFDLMGLLSEEKFLRWPRNVWFAAAKKMCASLEAFLLSSVDFITTINHQHKQILIKRVRKPIYVIRDGVFEAILKHPMMDINESLKASKLVLIFVGQLNYFRLDSLFNVLPDVIAESPNLQLQVLGAGSQMEHYQKRVDSLGMKGHVTFYGHVHHERIFDYIAKADMAYSDDWSVIGFPMKIFEYMALGKAIIAEGTESVKELLTDEVNALLCANDSELKEKVLTLAKDAALRKKLGQAARSLMGEHTWEKRVEALAVIYQQFIFRSGTL